VYSVHLGEQRIEVWRQHIQWWASRPEVDLLNLWIGQVAGLHAAARWQASLSQQLEILACGANTLKFDAARQLPTYRGPVDPSAADDRSA
jgi:hypothetical protein